jgi:hypothetical protein
LNEPLAPRTLYRLVETNPPTLKDFMSYHVLGIGLVDPNGDGIRLSKGISVFRTEAQARRVAKRRRFRGTFYIAEIAVPADATAQVERTTGTPGHYTLWADPDMIASWVVRVLLT